MSYVAFLKSFVEIQFTYHKIHLLKCIIQWFFSFLIFGIFTELCNLHHYLISDFLHLKKKSFFLFHVRGYTLATNFHGPLPLHSLELPIHFSSLWICLFWKYKSKQMVWTFVTVKFLSIKYVFMRMAAWNRMVTGFFHLA